MFSKTAARSKGYFSGLPAAAIAMGHSTVVQPFRRMRTKVRKTTAKFRRHAPPAPVGDESAHNAAVLSPVLPPLSPLDTEMWWRRSPPPPRPSSFASSTQNRSQSPFQPHGTEDIDAGSTSQVRRNSLWDQRFLPGLRIPNGFGMNNDASGQLLSPITPLHSPVSPSPLYPSNMISPTSFYSQDSIPNNDHTYSSTIDTTISLTTPVADIFTNTNANDENETNDDFMAFGREYTNAQIFSESLSAEHTADVQTNGNIVPIPYEFVNTQILSGSESTGCTAQGHYGAWLKELPSSHIFDDIPTFDLGPRASLQNLSAETSLHSVLSGRQLAIVIRGPRRVDSAFDDQAIDDILRELASTPVLLAQIEIEVNTGCEELPYAAELVNDLFSILQCHKAAPVEISVRLPVEQSIAQLQPFKPSNQLRLSLHDQDATEARSVADDSHIPPYSSHAMMQTFKRLPPIMPWWNYGRMDVSNLRSLSLSYPLVIDDFIQLLSHCNDLEVVNAGWLLAAESHSVQSMSKAVILWKLSSLSLVSTIDLGDFFNAVGMPSLASISLDIGVQASPYDYDVPWEELSEVTISCGMSLDGQNHLLSRCVGATRRNGFRCDRRGNY